MDQLERLAAAWQTDDPDFDAAALVAAVASCAAPSAEEQLDQLEALATRWEVLPDGARRMIFDFDTPARARAWLAEHLPATLPLLLLALRSPEPGVQREVGRLLADAPQLAAWPAIASVIARPAPNLAEHLGGRPQDFPTEAAIRLGAPTADRADALIALLDASDFRSAEAAAKVLAEHAADPRLADALVASHARWEREDGFAWALMRAAEVSRDARLREVLEGMSRARRRFPGAAYQKRIRKALDGLAG